MKPIACAEIYGNKTNPNLHGVAYFFNYTSNSVLIEIEVSGLPYNNSENQTGFYGLHIHEFGNCLPPFDKTGNHYNPDNAPHPRHAGDLPPLLGNDGYAFASFVTNRFNANGILNKSIVIHSERDDFISQPSGNSGEKIACGVIRRC